MTGTLSGLVGVLQKHHKIQHAAPPATGVIGAPQHQEPQQQQQQQPHSPFLLQPDMAYVCDSLRINERTRIALVEYDATTLEDLAYMTNDDLEGMLASAVRHDRPLCPLQQRKLVVLLWWVRKIIIILPENGSYSDTTAVALLESESKKEWEMTTLESTNDNAPMELKTSGNKEVEKMIVTGPLSKKETYACNTSAIPSNWKRGFDQDLPKIKRKLKELGETSSFSLYSDALLNTRWLLCGCT